MTSPVRRAIPTRRPHCRATPTRAAVAVAGFTLVEVLLAASILAFVVAAFTQAIVTGQAHAYQAVQETRAVSAAEALMAEIATKPYFSTGDTALDPGPETGETRATGFDEIDDYHGHSEAAGTLTDAQGAAYPDSYAKLARAVAVATASNAATVFGSNYSGVWVTVTVTDANGGTWELERFFPEPQE